MDLVGRRALSCQPFAGQAPLPNTARFYTVGATRPAAIRVNAKVHPAKFERQPRNVSNQAVEISLSPMARCVVQIPPAVSVASRNQAKSRFRQSCRELKP